MEQEKLFAKRIRKLRKAAGLTIEEAAERASLHTNTWSTVERNEYSPTLETILAMAKALKVQPYVLLHIDREEDEKSLRKRMEELLNQCDEDQLEMLVRLAKVFLEK